MKGVALLSGGIDSPAALYLMLKKNWDMVAIHMDNQPFTDSHTVEKFVKIVERLRRNADISLPAFIVPHGKNQGEIARRCTRRFQCVLCRRMMFRVASAFAEREGAKFIVTGESLGQVASQTLQNIFTEHTSAKFHVLRPLIGLDKVEIEKIAREAGTFEISTLPGMCCTIVPDKPATSARISAILEEERKLDIKAMVSEAVCQAREI
ncbi:MAG: 7-cyano-7-deazaguanine synthase [Thermoplasmata archaeon]